jgi:hypothetical protein
MIGLSRMTSWLWLLPPARGLAPASVVVAELVSRTAASRSAVSLAPTLTHALLPDGGRRVVLIQLDPGPLRVKECLMHIRIMTALEDGRHPGDVGHRSFNTCDVSNPKQTRFQFLCTPRAHFFFFGSIWRLCAT